MQFSDIDRAEISEKGHIEVYVGGKKLTTVDCLTDNFDRFKKTLANHGKFKE